ncbi:hypothetical protein [Pedobacter sp. NJ-S-72]
MTENFLENYFEKVAAKVKDIAHTADSKAFYRIHSKVDLDEFDNAVRSMEKHICLLAEFGSGTIGDWDSPRDIHAYYGLHVLVKSSDIFSEIKAARDHAKSTLIKIIVLMRKDIQDKFIYATDTAGPLKLAGIVFDSGGKYDDMDGVDGNWYGKSIYFDFKATINLAYNPNDYL